MKTHEGIAAVSKSFIIEASTRIIYNTNAAGSTMTEVGGPTTNWT